MQRIEALVSGWDAGFAGIETQAASLERLRVSLPDSSSGAPFAAGKVAIPDAMIAAAGGANVIQASGQRS